LVDARLLADLAEVVEEGLLVDALLGEEQLAQEVDGRGAGARDDERHDEDREQAEPGPEFHVISAPR
jgi:hypothetical protein